MKMIMLMMTMMMMMIMLTAHDATGYDGYNYNEDDYTVMMVTIDDDNKPMRIVMRIRMMVIMMEKRTFTMMNTIMPVTMGDNEGVDRRISRIKSGSPGYRTPNSSTY